MVETGISIKHHQPQELQRCRSNKYRIKSKSKSRGKSRSKGKNGVIDFLNRAEQSRAGQSRAEQSRAEQSRAEQSRAEQSRAEQSRAEQSRAEQSRKYLGDRLAVSSCRTQQLQQLQPPGLIYIRYEIRDMRSDLLR